MEGSFNSLWVERRGCTRGLFVWIVDYPKEPWACIITLQLLKIDIEQPLNVGFPIWASRVKSMCSMWIITVSNIIDFILYECMVYYQTTFFVYFVKCDDLYAIIFG